MKKLVVFFFSLMIFVFSTALVKAESLLIVDGNGEIVWKVLSSTDSISLNIPQREDLEILDLATNLESMGDAKISIEKIDGSISLNVNSEDGSHSLDVTGWQDDLIEVEERGETKKLAIRIKEGQFNLEQEGITVSTDYPINIDPKRNEISVQTPSGSRFLSILPIDAVKSALRARAITRFINQGASLVEEEGGELVYVLSGEKVLNLFNIFDYPVDVETRVSVLTGEIVNIKQPPWLKVLSFLLG